MKGERVVTADGVEYVDGMSLWIISVDEEPEDHAGYGFDVYEITHSRRMLRDHVLTGYDDTGEARAAFIFKTYASRESAIKGVIRRIDAEIARLSGVRSIWQEKLPRSY